MQRNPSRGDGGGRRSHRDLTKFATAAPETGGTRRNARRRTWSLVAVLVLALLAGGFTPSSAAAQTSAPQPLEDCPIQPALPGASPAATTSECEPGGPDDPPATGGPKAGFTYNVSRYEDRDGDTFPDPAKDAAAINGHHIPVHLDGCDSTGGASPIVAYVWSLNGAELRDTRCSTTWNAPGAGQYPVALTVEAADGSRHSQTQLVNVRKDLLIVSVGDSMASGEGNPYAPPSMPEELVRAIQQCLVVNRSMQCYEKALKDYPPQPAVWEDALCHRSAIAGSAQAARRMETSDPTTAVTFVHLACSGAQIFNPDKEMGGLLDGYVGQDAAYKTGELLEPQLEALQDLIGTREIDALMVSIGINDVGFESLVKTCIERQHCGIQEAWYPRLLDLLGSAQSGAGGRYDQLDGPATDKDVQGAVTFDSFPELRTDPSRVLINEYPDPTHKEDGGLCHSMVAGSIDGDEVKWAATVSPRLSERVAAAAGRHGWTLVTGLADRLLRHGECTEDHWFVQLHETILNQGNVSGAMHPNAKGHAQIKEAFLEKLEPMLRTPAAPNILVNGLAPGGTYLAGVSPRVIVTDRLGEPRPTITLDGAPYTSDTPINAGGTHRLLVEATNAAGVRSALTVPFTVVAPEISLTVAPTSVTGGTEVKATVSLNGTAPAGGVSGTIVSGGPAVVVPEPGFHVAAGTSSVEKVLGTVPVDQDTTVTVSASTTGGTPRTAQVVVQAPRVAALAVSPSSVAGGTATRIFVTLNGPAPAGGLRLTMETSHNAVVPGKILTVPGSANRAEEELGTSVVTELVTVTVRVSGHEASLSVFPATVRVPSVIGLWEDRAVALLHEFGLEAELAGDYGQRNSKVWQQSPLPNEVVSFGETVTLTMINEEENP